MGTIADAANALLLAESCRAGGGCSSSAETTLTITPEIHAALNDWIQSHRSLV